MNKIYPLVSIVTPTYNQAEYLAETIESVLAQDYPNIEYIVLDDGSTDHTRDVLKKYDGRLHWESQENMGQAKTLNKGWEIGSGFYIGYLSSDDILYPGAISKLVNILESNSDVSVVYPNCHLINPRSQIIKKNVSRKFDFESLVIRQECYIGPGALFRKDLFNKVGGWRSDLKLAPDREFWMRVGMYGHFEMIDEPLAGYRMHPKSISYYEKRPEIAQEYLAVLDDFFSKKDISTNILSRKNEAYSNALLIVARSHFRSNDFRGGIKKYREAIAIYPENKSVKTIISLIRTSISKPVRRLLWIFQLLRMKAKI
ncbi:glycosyltransferase family 2 protein [Collimonas sp.]|jgi:glycosyltransferase involved in cell wall biosynthesis|uniref:glycosyltransferase family 2 protein n=1 Tax=Collimonas sp. TaxID=1963772 RepID=UPI002C3D3145|nr:glycosyltransferase family 2 protein [Collimonas sp.]HWW04947.1 glycosyltransferase family 2 protein [Collimonas sp.]